MLKPASAALAGLLLALALAAPALAADCPKTSLSDIEDEVTCPVCGTPLQLAEAPQAQREREFIRGLIAKCKTKQEIKDTLVVQFGDEVLANPTERGFTISAVVVPITAVLIGAVLVVSLAFGWRRRGRGKDDDDDDQDSGSAESDDQGLVEDDMERYGL